MVRPPIGETQGFAEAWLDWHDSQKIDWGKWSFLLAVAVAMVTFLGWLLSVHS
jgi:hypothetical protein